MPSVQQAHVRCCVECNRVCEWYYARIDKHIVFLLRWINPHTHALRDPPNTPCVTGLNMFSTFALDYFVTLLSNKGGGDVFGC